MKLEITAFKKGDLLYWNDFWNATCGIGVFLNYVKDFNTRDIAIKEKYYTNSCWVNVLITKVNGSMSIRVFPPTSVCLQTKFKNLEEFDKYIKNFRNQ